MCQKLIPNPMTGKNRHLVSKWFTPSELHYLERLAEPGDLLEMNRGSIQHWGVFCGRTDFNEGTREIGIIHFGMDSDEARTRARQHTMLKPNICVNKLVDVVGNSKIRLNNRNDSSLVPAQDINTVNKRIQAILDEQEPYDVFQHNCEKFAKYCRYGKQHSQQSALLVIVVIFVLMDYPMDVALSVVTLALVTYVCFCVLDWFWPSVIGPSLRFVGNLACYLCFPGMVAALCIGGHNYIIGMNHVTLVLDFLNFGSLLVGLYRCVILPQLKVMVFVVVLSTAISIAAPTPVLFGMGLPALVFVLGLSFVIGVLGLEYPQEHGVLLIFLGYLFSAVLPTYLVVVGLPGLLLYLRRD